MKPGNRRILHQPLVPIQWTPPPPPPPSPLVFSTNPLTATTATTSSSPTHHDSSSTKIAVIVASISISLFCFLSLLFLLFQHREAQNSPSKSKREVSFGSLLAPAGDDNSEVGFTEPTPHTHDEMVQLEFNHPSPEIKPLPPLLTGVVQWSLSHPSPEIKPLAPLPRKPPENIAVSDDYAQLFTAKPSLERSYSWSGTTRFSIGSSPNLQQQRSPLTQPVDLNGNVEEVDMAGSETGMNDSDMALAWGRFKSRSLGLDEDMIEIITTSFGKERIMPRRGAASASLLKRENRVLNPEKAESIEILLRTSTVKTEDVCGALLDGGSEYLGTEFWDSLIKLAPTKEEEFLLRHYRGEVTSLNAAERFLKAVLEVPFAMKRIEVMLYRARFETNIDYLKKSFQTLQDACQDLRRNKLFLKLLEAATGTGNQLNDDNTQENAKLSRLDCLLDLCDAEVGGKVTPLHFTVEDLISNQNMHSDIIREEEFKKKGLKAVAGLSAEFENVKKAADMDLQFINDHVQKQDLGLEKVRWLLQLDKACKVGENFFKRMKKFANEAEMEIENIKEQEEMTLRCIRETTDYFNLVKDSANPLRILILVRDFLLVLDGVCKDIGRMQDRAMIGSLSGRFSHISPIPSAVT